MQRFVNSLLEEKDFIKLNFENEIESLLDEHDRFLNTQLSQVLDQPYEEHFSSESIYFGEDIYIEVDNY